MHARLGSLKYFEMFGPRSSGATIVVHFLRWLSVPRDQFHTPNRPPSFPLSMPIYKVESPSVGDMTQYGYLGKLGTKVEAAGKIRVFAMVDAWTQWLLNPIHKTLFRALSNLSTDGTFDQLRPLKVLVDYKYKKYFSYDLTAATDRLPVVLQEYLLQPLLGYALARGWKELLVDRFYWFKGSPTKGKSLLLRYKVGQPMGALSSWAMLAMTHHYIIQLCW